MHATERQLLSICAVASLLTGCGVLDTINPPPRPNFEVVGENGDALILAFGRDDASELIAPSSDRAVQVDIVTLALDTGQSEVIARGISISHYPISLPVSADGSWVAWLSPSDSGIHVQSIPFDTEMVLQADTAVVGPLTGLQVIGKYLVTTAGDCSAIGPCELVVTDLESGGESRVGNSLGYGQFAIVNDRLALFRSDVSDVKVIGWELGTALDVVDLTTDAHETVLPEIRIAGDGGSLIGAEESFTLQHFVPNRFTSRITRVYFDASGTATTVTSSATLPVYLWLLDATDTELLFLDAKETLVHGSYSILVGNDPDNLKTVASFDITFPYNMYDLDSYRYVDPRLAATKIYWLDWVDGTIVVHDPATGSTSRIEPSSVVFGD